jgi:hypothetical protein
MKIEHGSYAFEKANLPAFDAEPTVTMTRIEVLKVVLALGSMRETTHYNEWLEAYQLMERKALKLRGK